MRRFLVLALAMTAAVALALAGCTQPQAAPTPGKAAEPTKAAAAPTKGIEPTKAPAPQPTAAPAKQVDYPVKGRPMTMIVPWAAGGGSDLSGRLAAAWLEKDLGITAQVVNKAGAAGQVGLTDLAKSKPDGYNLLLASIPSIMGSYLDPDRKAVYSRKDIQQVANLWWDPMAAGVQTDSPFKTFKDLVDAAKARPGEVKLGTSGIGGDSHMSAFLIEKSINIKFNLVHLESAAGQNTSLAGGHVDVILGPRSGFMPILKGGSARLIGVLDSAEDKAFPGVPTLESMGYKVNLAASRGIAGPAGIPKEVVDILAASLKKYSDSDEFKAKAVELSLGQRYMNAAQYTAYWDEVEALAKPVIDAIRLGQ